MFERPRTPEAAGSIKARVTRRARGRPKRHKQHEIHTLYTPQVEALGAGRRSDDKRVEDSCLPEQGSAYCDAALEPT